MKVIEYAELFAWLVGILMVCGGTGGLIIAGIEGLRYGLAGTTILQVPEVFVLACIWLMFGGLIVLMVTHGPDETQIEVVKGNYNE